MADENVEPDAVPNAIKIRQSGARIDREQKGEPVFGPQFERLLPEQDTLLQGTRMYGGSGELKVALLAEGSTVKEFAEKLGIKPQDVVTFLLQRGVFAAINQPLNHEVATDLGKRFGYHVTFVRSTPGEILDATGKPVEIGGSGLITRVVNRMRQSGTTNITLSQEEFDVLSAKTSEVLAAAALAEERIAKDQETIDQLKMETREILSRLRAA